MYEALTYEGQILGTPGYIAPEQIVDSRRADIRADIYSLGCTLYYLLTGKPPFHGGSLYDVLHAHRISDAVPLNRAPPDVPVEVAAIATRMIAKDPHERYQTPKDVAQALKPFFRATSRVAEARSMTSSKSGPSAAVEAISTVAIPTPQPKTTQVSASSPKTGALPRPTWSRGQESAAAAETGSIIEMTLADSGMPRRVTIWLWPALGIVVLLTGLLAAWTSGVLSRKADDGLLILEDLPANTVLEVDGKPMRVTSSAGESRSARAVWRTSRRREAGQGRLVRSECHHRGESTIHTTS